MKFKNEIALIEKTPASSAWDKGVKLYALDLVRELQFDISEYERPSEVLLNKALLNGASDWAQYSNGGCGFIYNADIVDRLCTPSEAKRKKNGDLPPNRNETWLDCQARALYQASRLVRCAFDDSYKTGWLTLGIG